HAIVVDQLDPPVADQYIAVLQIAVRDFMAPERGERFDPATRQVLQGRGIVEVPFYVDVERFAVDPLHLQDRIPLAADANSLAEKLEPHGRWEIGGQKVRADRPIAGLMVRDLPQETPHRPAPRTAIHLIHAGESPGDRLGQAERRQFGRAVAQLRVPEANPRVLDGFVVVLRRGAGHSGSSDKNPIACKWTSPPFEGGGSGQVVQRAYLRRPTSYTAPASHRRSSTVANLLRRQPPAARRRAIRIAPASRRNVVCRKPA